MTPCPTSGGAACVPGPARLEPGAQLEAFLATVVLGAVLDPLPAAQRADAGAWPRLPEPGISGPSQR